MGLMGIQMAISQRDCRRLEPDRNGSRSQKQSPFLWPLKRFLNPFWEGFLGCAAKPDQKGLVEECFKAATSSKQ